MRVFSGVQPTGTPHLGNYLGAFRNWSRMQGTGENFYCVVDLHSLTVPYEPEELRENTRRLAAIILGAGIDPEQSSVFVQSHVSAHAEACWLMNCITPIGWLQRMTQFKDKSAKQESVGTGLLDYPVLMACDILLYDASEVPVGDDQKQHVELARNIAQRFNHLYGETLVVPEPVIPKQGARVMGLDDPTAKMSKSSTNRGHAIAILDEPKEIERSIKRAQTDSYGEIVYSTDPERAGVRNLLDIWAAVHEIEPERAPDDFADARGYGDLKQRVADAVIALLDPVRTEAARFLEDRAELDRILRDGASAAEAVAGAKLREIKDRMGLVLPSQAGGC